MMVCLVLCFFLINRIPRKLICNTLLKQSVITWITNFHFLKEKFPDWLFVQFCDHLYCWSLFSFFFLSCWNTLVTSIPWDMVEKFPYINFPYFAPGLHMRNCTRHKTKPQDQELNGQCVEEAELLFHSSKNSHFRVWSLCYLKLWPNCSTDDERTLLSNSDNPASFTRAQLMKKC